MAADQKEKHHHLENAFSIYARLFTYVRKYWPALVAAIVASMLYASIDSFFIYSLKPLLNQGLVNKDVSMLKWAPLGVIVIFALRGTMSFLSNFNMALVANNLIFKMRQNTFSHLIRLPASVYDKASSGQFLSIIVYSVDQLANVSADIITSSIQSSFMVCGCILVMCLISWKLTLMYFLIIPLVAVIARRTGLRTRRLSLTIQEAIAKVIQRTEENITGYKVVRGFGGEQYESEKFNEAANTTRQREMKVVATRAWGSSSVQFVAAIAVALTLYVAARDIAGSVLSPGGFVAMIAAMLAMLKPMKDLTTVQNKLHRGLAAAQVIFNFLDQPTESDTGKVKLTQPVAGKIIFSDVSFSYEAVKPVLQNVSFTVNPGEVVALVGRSGSGKSTLVNLLPRFYTDFSGEILLDDVSVRDYCLADLRQQFAFVSQQVVLFNDTIANNIAYGCFKKVTEADILAAAKAAYAYDFIEKLPQGLHTVIGDNGLLLSGGQRQRIAIARAILKKAPILILDEATSALDTESERYIQEALEKLMRTCTTLVIAHRLSTIEKADKILVLDKGHIIEAGTHHHLKSQDGFYAKLYNMQFAHSTSIEIPA